MKPRTPQQDKDCYEENREGEELTSLAENAPLSWRQARSTQPCGQGGWGQGRETRV